MNIVQLVDLKKLVDMVDSKKLVELCSGLKIEGKDAADLLFKLALTGGGVCLGKYAIDRVTERLNSFRIKMPDGEVIEAKFSDPVTSES